MKNNNAEKTALDYLECDSVLNADIINTLRSNMGKMLYCGDDGVLVYNTPGEVFLMNASCAECAERMLPLIAGAYALVAHNEELIPMLMERLGFKHRQDCHQLAYTGKTPLPLRAPADTVVRRLTREHTDFVAEHYSHSPDRQYIEERIDYGMLGAFVSGELAGFVGVHDEGSIGMLEIVPKFKRLGLGSLLEASMINARLEQGFIPYGQVILGNLPSERLQNKLGLSRAEGIVSWLTRKDVFE